MLFESKKNHRAKQSWAETRNQGCRGLRSSAVALRGHIAVAFTLINEVLELHSDCA